jgi:hypothetical protein
MKDKRSRLRRIWDGFVDFLGALLRVVVSILKEVDIP